MGKISSYPIDSSPANGDYLLGDTAGGVTSRFPVQNILGLLAASGNTLLLSELQTYTPTIGGVDAGSTAGGATSYYINLGGIKLAFVNVTVNDASEGGSIVHVTGVEMPPGFFTNLLWGLPGIFSVGGSPNQTCTMDNDPSTTSFAFYVGEIGNGDGCSATFLFMGN